MRGWSEKRVEAKQGQAVRQTFEEEVDAAAEHEPHGRQEIGFANCGPYCPCQNGGDPKD